MIAARIQLSRSSLRCAVGWSMWKGDSLDRVLDVVRSRIDREILRILANSEQGAYPSQLARRLRKDRTLLNRRLRHLHDLGLVTRIYEVRDGMGVVVYRARQRSITIHLDFRNATASVERSQACEGTLAIGARVLTRLARAFPPILPM